MATLARFAEQRAIRFTLLSDRGSAIIRGFGLINEQMKGSPWYGIANPMIVVLDAAGIVRHRFSFRDYTRRPDPDAVLAVLGAAASR